MSLELETQYLHQFEKAGLGAAPFRCVASYEKTYQACQGAPIQPGGSCDYCAAGIRYVFLIQGADGRKFEVGSSCVEKCAKKGDRVLTEVQAEARRIKREAKRARDLARIDRLTAHVEQPEVKAELSSQPHPLDFRAAQGDTRLDGALWTLKNAGVSGCIRLARELGVK